MAAPARHRRFAVYAWAVLVYTLGVIVWGAYVRASSSGAGCGDRWPLCNGQFLPQFPRIAVMIEFLHRVSSGLDLLLILGLLTGALALYPRRHVVRRAAWAATIFIIVEALLGASLVLFGLVEQNLSAARVVVLSLHLVNTLVLLASLALAAAWATGREAAPSLDRPLWVGAIGLLITGVCGAITALGDTLFPASSLGAGLRQDISTGANWLLRLRVTHPLIALAVGLYLIFLVAEAAPSRSRGLGWALAAVIVAQWSLGAADIALLTPLWAQMLHLLVADLLWIVFVLYAATAARVPSTAR